jgi:hypothetical protein
MAAASKGMRLGEVELCSESPAILLLRAVQIPDPAARNMTDIIALAPHGRGSCLFMDAAGWFAVG